jgi:nicotinate-nucleotide adenylyltransferase
MRVGLLGGSFDPVHYGHLRAAEWSLAAFALDSVRLVPALQSPFKGPCIATAEERRQMLDLAIAGNPSFVVEDCELWRTAPSYTVDTLRVLTRKEPDTRFVLIIGSDAARDIEKWRESDEIQRLAEIRALARPGDAMAAPADDVAPLNGVEISSTAIRRAVQRGQSIRYLTPESVRFFIEEKGLYK